MHGSHLSLALAKAIIVSTPLVARIRPSERHVLKDLLYQLPDLNQEDWLTMSCWIDRAGEDDRAAVAAEIRAYLSTPDHRATIFYALERVFASIPRLGLTLAGLETLLATLLNDPHPACWRQLGGLVEDSLLLRLSSDCEYPPDLDGLRALVMERTRHWLAHDTSGALDTDQRNRLCLEGILIAKVAHADEKVDSPERHLCQAFLCRVYGLREAESEFVLNASLGHAFDALDTLRVCRWLYELTTEDERLRFMELLFDLATVDQHLSDSELDVLISVAANLRLEQEQFHALFMAHGGDDTPPLFRISGLRRD